METIRITDLQIISGILVFFRVSALLFTAPFFGSRDIPVQVRILISFAIAVVIMSAGPPYKDLPSPALKTTWGLVLAVIRETLLGIAIGFIARLVFVGIQMAGQLIGNEMGFGMMNILDPSTNTLLMVTAELNTIFATLIFLITNSHHYVLMGIARSFETVPLAGWSASSAFIWQMNTVMGGVFVTALRLAIPVVSAVFLTKIAMAIIVRVIPQINVFVVGFSLQISIGLIIMALSLPFLTNALFSLFASMREFIWLILR